MATNSLDISMDQGSSLTHTFTLKYVDNTAFDLTGYDARLQVRRTYGDTAALINCTLPNGKLVVSDAVGGVLQFILTPADTSGIRFANKDDDTLECVYDLEIISPTAKVYKPARGAFTLMREVTR